VQSFPTQPSEELHPPEWANTLTHGLGVALSVAGLSVLVPVACWSNDAWRIASASVYGSILVVLYLVSTLYHAARHPRLKRLLRVLDHGSIYLLIAGTYTPFTLVNLRGGLGWTLFGVIWGLALLGLFWLIVLGRMGGVSVLIYIAMGWTALAVLKPTIEAVDTPGLVLLVTGGLAYTLGTIFFLWTSLPHHHAVWHLFVLAGSILHYFAVLLYV
jgi:hemolysin III